MIASKVTFRLQPKTGFSRLPLVRGPNLKVAFGSEAVLGIETATLQRMVFL